MAHGWVGVTVLATLVGGCTQGGHSSAGLARFRHADTASVVYVSADAHNGGNGSDLKHAFQTVEQGVYAACDLPAPRTVLVAAGSYGGSTDGKPADQDEVNIYVRCPMTIRGATVLGQDNQGLPDGTYQNESLIRVPLLTDGDSIFQVISSDVTIERFVLQGASTAGFVQGFLVGGFPQADDPDQHCPQAPVSDVEIRDSVLQGTGAGVVSYNASVNLHDLYEVGNLSGFVILGGPDDEDVTSEVYNDRSMGGAFGACFFSTDFGYGMNCPDDVTDPRSMGHTAILTNNDLSHNFWAGLRESAYASVPNQADAPTSLTLWATDNDLSNESNWGIMVDVPTNSRGLVLTSPNWLHGIYTGNQLGNNGRNDMFVTFKFFATSLYPTYALPADYATATTVALDTSPHIDGHHVDRDVPASDDYGDLAIEDGANLVGTRITAPSP